MVSCARLPIAARTERGATSRRGWGWCRHGSPSSIFPPATSRSYGRDGTALVANGEIYNYVELKRDFAAGAFKTNSDCEVPLATYARDGADFARFCAACMRSPLHDARDHALYLARDPFGIKPLYYAEYPGGMIFASELQALLKTGLVAPKVRIEAARELVQLQFTTGRDTIFEKIYRVAPGETLSLRGGRIVGRRQKPALPEGSGLELGEAEALKLLDAALMDSVAVHQRSDVPYGMFLSGGVDSSAILACMARLNDTPVRAFTAGFPAPPPLTNASPPNAWPRRPVRTISKSP